ncbi:unnamed protein product [Owenia fusiformis]|uniref:Alpha-mannosidase n=1 Tax=Owenia fusiformis TaxID=6347 RepID=A0A8J1UK84_OWEFU|nr:unnamed protein product [Owenia fusiformis]
MELFAVGLTIILQGVLLGLALPADFRFTQFDFLRNDLDQQDQPSKCGYESCNLGKPDVLNVHLVPHTHDDVGWLKTVDQYYYGAKENIQRAGVEYILDSVVDELLKDPNKRFIYVEIAFFYRWWNQQTDARRHNVKRLVNEGRLEFILGGWCMNDEAATHYNAIIDQHTLGFKFLKDNFGDCARPRVAWQIDPFGHSREQASLFAQMGFDGLFFGRLDYQDKAWRLNNRTMEHMWRGSPDNLGDAANLFTGALYNGYGPPGGFCWDAGCGDDPVMDDRRLHDYNVDEKVAAFVKAATDQAKNYQTNHIVMTMGSDFQYSNANTWYKNLDKLIKYVNMQQKEVNVFYSTPSCYLYSLNKAGKKWTTKEDDFFPYAHRNNSFWTGYFTSRAAFKGMVRDTNNLLQACKQLDILANLGPEHSSSYKIDVLKRAMGVSQHHDAVSGTEKQAVAYDYAERLANGSAECQEVINIALNKLQDKAPSIAAALEWKFCNYLNVSKCGLTENNTAFYMTVYNPLGRPVDKWLRLPVRGKAYTIYTGPNGELVPNQVVPLSKETKMVPDHNNSRATADLVFKASLPALGFNTYYISQSSGRRTAVRKVRQNRNSDVTLKNERVSVVFDSMTGLVKEMTNTDKGISIPLSQNFFYYIGHDGDNSKPEKQASGAYIFRPNETNPYPINTSATLEIVNGELVNEVRQVFSNYTSQVVRLYAGSPYVEFEWTVGPIPIGDNKGREVITRYMTKLASDNKFYTDANGREILQRVRNYRPTWKLNQTEPVAGNYYPINSRAFIRDEVANSDIQFTVLNDRSQGGGSIQDGNLEIMLHRRLLHDDSLGVGEPLNETGVAGNGLVVRGKHYVYLGDKSSSAKLHRDLGEEIFMAPITAFTTSKLTPEEWAEKHTITWSGVRSALPSNVHLLTLEQWNDKALLRLENFYEKTEAEGSGEKEVQIQDLFAPFRITSMVELNLGGNQPLSQASKLQWETEDGQQGDVANEINDFEHHAPFSVKLTPMQIRTFEVTLSYT